MEYIAVRTEISLHSQGCYLCYPGCAELFLPIFELNETMVTWILTDVTTFYVKCAEDLYVLAE